MIVLQEVMNELSLYVVSFDRAGYGQSDPNPKRTLKSDVEDVEDLANGLGLRPKFYVIASSIGSYTGWGLLKYKPERLAGVAFSAPMVNYWWPGFPKSEMTKAWGTQRTGDKMSFRVAHHLPGFTYWYNMVQKRLPRTVLESEDESSAFNEKDQEYIEKLPTIVSPEVLTDSISGAAYSLLYFLSFVLSFSSRS
jgi:pimeloyl-ACP methyl ester carboxylesterase